MIQLIGVKSDIKLEIREKFSVIQKRCERSLKNLNNICDEVVIISTCNRTEIYFKASYTNSKIVEEIFDVLGWDKNLIQYTFHYKEEKAIEHLMKVVCGFDSLILGEDQILAQIKEAYETAKEASTISGELRKLFNKAVTCGKEFRTKSNLYKIPVSSSSIAVNESKKQGAKKFMILGFGEVGKLTTKYILSSSFDKLYIAARSPKVVDIEDERVTAIQFDKRINIYNEVDCIISCTSAPHTVIRKEDLSKDKKVVIFDLAVPRDVDKDVEDLENVKVYDIDSISKIDDTNRKLRKETMKKNKYILEKYIREFEEWRDLQGISREIVRLKKSGEKVYKDRYETFKNKKSTKDPEKLAEMLLKSTSDAFINRAIDVLKEEHLKGRADECMKIIEKIFYVAK